MNRVRSCIDGFSPKEANSPTSCACTLRLSVVPRSVRGPSRRTSVALRVATRTSMVYTSWYRPMENA